MPGNLYIEKMGKKAKIASLHLSNINIDKRNAVLKQFCHYLKTNERLILSSNKKDIFSQSKTDLSSCQVLVQQVRGVSNR